MLKILDYSISKEVVNDSYHYIITYKNPENAVQLFFEETGNYHHIMDDYTVINRMEE